MTTAIRTRGLTKSFGSSTVVNSLDLDVDTGDIFGFLGPNGAGKTTTLRMLCGLLPPTSGTMEVAGLDVNRNRTKLKPRIGLLPESSGLYGWMNAGEYLLHFASLYRIEPEEAKRRQVTLLEHVGLADKSSVPVSFFSRGMKQRLGLARALINNPDILFLDEPTLGLDPQGQKDIRKILLRLSSEGMTIVLSSHILGDVASLCNRFAIINQGTLAAQGTFEELRTQVNTEKTDGIFFRVRKIPEMNRKISRIPWKITAIREENDLVDIAIGGTSDTNPAVIWFVEAGFTVLEMRKTGSDLEDIFFALTGNPSSHDSQVSPGRTANV